MLCLSDDACPYFQVNHEQVMQLVKERESLIKISFLSHSLGGLIARYAISVLYTPSPSSAQSDGMHTSSSGNANPMCSSNKGLIAGLEPINFITLATPHLGVRGNKQVYSPSFFWVFHNTPPPIFLLGLNNDSLLEGAHIFGILTD